MTTTDTTALQERLALAISEAEFCRRCEALSMSCEACEARAAAVLPIVAEEVRKAKAEALREAAHYFAGGLHCADMRSTPEETVRELNRRATEYETGAGHDD